METLRPGDPSVIGGIRIFGRLGSGGFGTVYLGQSRLGRWVAVKILNLSTVSSEARQRLAREAKAVRLVDSPFAAALEEVSISGSPPYLVSQYVAGPTLAEVKEEFRALSTAEYEALGAGLAQALVDLHSRGVIHRDVKPANVILGAQGPVLVDMGIARTASDTMRTQTGLVAGTPNWIPPEHAQGFDSSSMSDVWGWGACMRWTMNRHGIQLPDDHPIPELMERCLGEEASSRPTPEHIVQVLTDDEDVHSYVTERWDALQKFAQATQVDLPTLGANPTVLDEASELAQTRVEPQVLVQPAPPVPAPAIVPQGHGVAWGVAGAFGVLIFIGILVSTLTFGQRWLTQTVGPEPAVTVSETIVEPARPEPAPTVTITQEAIPRPNPSPSGPDPSAPRGGEQELIDELAFAMNLQDWGYVDSLCNPRQTCEVMFSGFFQPRYSRGQWIDTSFSQFLSCRYNVPSAMARGCTNPNRWVGNIFFTCFKNGQYGYQTELTSFTFTYANGYPQIERFDPVSLTERAEECY